MKTKNNQLQIALILLLTLFTLVTLGTVSRWLGKEMISLSPRMVKKLMRPFARSI